MKHWVPAGMVIFSGLDIIPPEPGILLANDRILWRVVAVHEKHTANWDPKHASGMQKDLRSRDWARRKPIGSRYREIFAALVDWDGQAETWPNRPRTVEVCPAAGGRRRHLPWPHRGWAAWYPVDEHHPVCARCGELYPCREVDAARQAAREMQRVDELMSVRPGCCWHCQEPISHRQASQTFPGENLLLPGAPSPSFHLRRTGGCRDAAAEYEKRWQASEQGKVAAPDLFGDEQA
ncbi:hypothetical protein [Parafrankia sp. EUN1f]|uniref:hypothetical protein n=1 Tax=Parafrankia sp. EUN1f TaxID=102897 RepID=UPI0001C47472|nr:hypothetical protein [Parafrankia sp. EUN1f]EFC80068.1 hypothetical protein FrEUN1fDRAFT_6795 [Parafrankia sp. EUN1f]